jgi:hypothetical protein
MAALQWSHFAGAWGRFGDVRLTTVVAFAMLPSALQGSSNGRTRDFGSRNGGSNPPP